MRRIITSSRQLNDVTVTFKAVKPDYENSDTDHFFCLFFREGRFAHVINSSLFPRKNCAFTNLTLCVYCQVNNNQITVYKVSISKQQIGLGTTSFF